MNARSGLAAMLASAAIACGDGTTALPEATPFRELVPGVRLGMDVVELEAARPDVEVWMDGWHRETLRTLTIQYDFTPKAENEAPPAWAELRAVESRDQVRDSLVLAQAWLDAVRSLEIDLGRSPRCLWLGGAAGTIRRAEFPDSVALSISGEIWRAPDGQSHDAYLVARAGVGSFEVQDEAGLHVVTVDCGELWRSAF